MQHALNSFDSTRSRKSLLVMLLSFQRVCCCSFFPHLLCYCHLAASLFVTFFVCRAPSSNRNLFIFINNRILETKMWKFSADDVCVDKHIVHTETDRAKRRPSCAKQNVLNILWKLIYEVQLENVLFLCLGGIPIFDAVWFHSCFDFYVFAAAFVRLSIRVSCRVTIVSISFCDNSHHVCWSFIHLSMCRLYTWVFLFQCTSTEKSNFLAPFHFFCFWFVQIQFVSHVVALCFQITCWRPRLFAAAAAAAAFFGSAIFSLAAPLIGFDERKIVIFRFAQMLSRERN